MKVFFTSFVTVSDVQDMRSGLQTCRSPPCLRDEQLTPSELRHPPEPAVFLTASCGFGDAGAVQELPTFPAFILGKFFTFVFIPAAEPWEEAGDPVIV